MASDGLLLWANSIRTTMASDKARTEFAEHMQSRGFSWLDQYLGDVLEKARDGDEELFDLMKTPGRKKTIVRKVPTTGSRLKNMVAVDENDEDADSKENVAPAQNTFYKALLAAKSPEPAKPFSSPNNQPSSPLPDQTVRRISAHPREPSPPLPTPTLHYQDSLGFPHFPHMDPAALSMIVEDDEGSARNTSRTSNAAERGPLQPAANRFLQGVAEEDAEEDMQAIRPLSLASTADTFHSVPMSPEEKITEQAQEPAVVASSGPSGSGAPAQETSRSRQESETPAPPSPPAARASVEPSTWSSIAAPLPDVSKAKASQDVVMAEPAVEPAQQYTDVLVPLRDEDTAGPRPPSPLRKSLRAVREQSSGAILVGNATPGPVAGGQRTSWLMKTRAVSRKVSGLGGPTHVPRTTLGGMKRKSEDTMHIPGLPSEDDTRHHKALKMLETDAASNKPLEYAEPTLPTSEFASATEDGIIDRLRKTMQGMKPIAPVSNDALADAKASAEAKVAERHQADISIISTADPLSLARTSSAPASDRAAPANRTSSRRMSVSELIPANEKGVVFKPPLPPHPAARESTTPANSPPPSLTREPAPQPAPVFSKPRVFVPPPEKERPTPLEFHFQPAAVRNLPASTSMAAVGLSPRLQSPPSHKSRTPLTAQSTAETIGSDKIFDNDGDIPGSWEPTTQDTEYTSFGNTQKTEPVDIADDDSWSDDERPAPPVFPGTGPDANPTDTYNTTSTMTTSSYKFGASVSRDTRFAETRAMEEDPPAQVAPVVPAETEMDIGELNADDMDVDVEKDVRLVKPSTPPGDDRPASQLSDASSIHPTTFLGHAQKFVSSMLGSGKKGKPVKPEVKSLQLAAAAAKKDQDEREKKEKRLKEMEHRRQLAAQRKVEEEKARKDEQERRANEERERRKREREETTGKLPVPVARTNTTKDEDTTKKRKIELQKQPSKSALKPTMHPPSSTTKTLTKAPSKTALASSSSTPTYKAAEPKSTIPTKSKGKTPAKAPEDDGREPSQVLQNNMAARAKAQMQAAKAAAEPNLGPTENIELPDINSEYSDSDDEDRKTYDVADWAQSPDLARMLRVQSTINPDEIFGDIRPLRMEEIFRTRQSRFRARTSSANWTGSDRLTVEEQQEYARRMGYR